jgi:hypothetical protein
MLVNLLTCLLRAKNCSEWNVHSVTVNLKRDMCSNVSTIRHCSLLDMIFKPGERVKQIFLSNTSIEKDLVFSETGSVKRTKCAH